MIDAIRLDPADDVATVLRPLEAGFTATLSGPDGHTRLTLREAIPASWSLDFAVPVCFIALVAPMLRSAPHIVAALAACAGAVAFAWLPWSLGIFVAATLGILAGAQAELFLKRRRQPA